jgi:phytoene dehydrogenase-like protein
VKSFGRIGLRKKLLFPFYFPNLFRFYQTSHKTVLDRLFRGAEIKMVLHSLPATEPPSRLSFLFVAALISKALMEGVYYPKGGMGKVSEAMAKSLLRSGGEINLKTEVDQVLVKDGKVEGIKTRKGEIFQSPLVISDTNPNILTKMISPEFQRPFIKDLRRFEYSQSCFILYLATDMDLRGMKLPYFTYLRFISDLEEESRMFHRGEIPDHPTIIVSIPTLLDASLAPIGQYLIKVLVTVPFHYQEKWGKGNSEQYRRLKEEFSQRILEQLELRLIPNLRKRILFYEAATPLTLERYTGNERGAMYGLASTPGQIGNGRPSHRTPIPGLFRVGHYTRPSHGIVGAALSGLFAARAILQTKERDL